MSDMAQSMPASSSPLSDLTAFQRDALAAITRLDGPHGLAIKDELENAYEQEIHHGRLYPNLDELAEMGLVDKRTKDARTNEYSITSRGCRELEAHWEWQATSELSGVLTADD